MSAKSTPQFDATGLYLSVILSVGKQDVQNYRQWLNYSLDETLCHNKVVK